MAKSSVDCRQQLRKRLSIFIVFRIGPSGNEETVTAAFSKEQWQQEDDRETLQLYPNSRLQTPTTSDDPQAGATQHCPEVA